jgi:hypothetical protein
MVGILNFHRTTIRLLKVRIPKFLTPRRRYEVDESNWLVIWGRPKVIALWRVSRPVALEGVKDGRKGLVFTLRGLLAGMHAVEAGGRKLVLFIQWGRMPKAWELSFVSKMKLMEAQGIPFPEVLKTYLPTVIGEAPSGVLLNWVGRSTRHQPKRFTNAVAEMFGKSSRSIITGLEKTADPEQMLDARRPVEPPYQSLVDAIRAADGEIPAVS